ncbi:MAG: hypothetical protein RLZ98_2032 [Pseudomonadota bacterium]|jgi:3-oxoacyl-[acyl-carrier protein] reductase
MAGFEGRTALVTGAGDGMGRSHALLLAERGSNVIVQDVNPDGARETADAIAKLGRRSHVIACDISDVAAFRAGLAEAEKAVAPVDILVNNAGVSGRSMRFEDVTEDIFDRMIAVHVKGTFFASQAVMPGMRDRGWGRVVNISSTYGIAGARNASHYAGAKAALLGFTKTWARELAPYNVTVNAVAPGFIKTNMTMSNRTEADLPERIKPILKGRAGVPMDISYAVVWLASEEADFVTGQVISPNGGEYIT